MQQAVIFVRIFDHDHDYQRQVEELRAIGQSQAVQVVAEIIDKVSVTQTNQQREGMQQLLALSRQGAIQKVLVSTGLHLGNSMVEFFQLAKELTQLGVSIYLQDISFETLENGKLTPIAQTIFSMVAEFAQLDREILRERILSRLNKVQRQGRHIGRPAGIVEEQAVFLKKYTEVAIQLRQGLSVRKTARVCEVAINTVRKVKAML